jgi:uncharacterized membrane protein
VVEGSRIALLDESDRAALITQLIEHDPGLLQLPELLKLTQVVQKSHSGPLPSPEDFAQYERALAGSCDRILSMAERQQSFAHEISRRRLDGDFREALRGQACALLLGLMGTAACVVTAQMGADWRVSAGLGAAAMGLLVVPFLRGTRGN